MSGDSTNSSSETRLRTAGRGVRRLTRPVYARIVTDPSSYKGFSTIRVGDAATSRSTREVQTTARLLSKGVRQTDHTAVVVEEESGELIAFATVRRSPFPVERFFPEVDVTAFGRDVNYKEVKLRDGTTTCGEIAVIAALDVIALAFGELPSPEVWARVLPKNAGSHAIFDRLQFLHLKPLRQPVQLHPGKLAVAVEDQDLRVQHANKPLEWVLDPEVYVPPEKPAEPFLTPMDHTNPPRPFTMPRNGLCICDSGRKWKKCCEHGPGETHTTAASAPRSRVTARSARRRLAGVAPPPEGPRPTGLRVEAR
jgi:SEC-C motif